MIEGLRVQGATWRRRCGFREAARGGAAAQVWQPASSAPGIIVGIASHNYQAVADVGLARQVVL